LFREGGVHSRKIRRVKPTRLFRSESIVSLRIPGESILLALTITPSSDESRVYKYYARFFDGKKFSTLK